MLCTYFLYLLSVTPQNVSTSDFPSGHPFLDTLLLKNLAFGPQIAELPQSQESLCDLHILPYLSETQLHLFIAQERDDLIFHCNPNDIFLSLLPALPIMYPESNHLFGLPSHHCSPRFHGKLQTEIAL